MCIKDEHKYQAVIDNHKKISTGQFTGATIFILVMIAIFGGWKTCKNQTEVILACIAGLVSIIFFFVATIVWYRKSQVAEKCGRVLETKSLKSKDGDSKQSGECKEQQKQCCLFIMRESDEEYSIFSKAFFKPFFNQAFWSKTNPRLAVVAFIIWLAFTIASLSSGWPLSHNSSKLLNNTSLIIKNNKGHSWSVTAMDANKLSGPIDLREK